MKKLRPVILLAWLAPAVNGAGAVFNIGAFWTNSLTNYTWTGNGNDGLWSDGNNWKGGAMPTSTSAVIFDHNCGNNCNVTIDAASAAAKSITLASTFYGTVTLGAGNALTVGTSGVTIAAGKLDAGSGTMTVSGGFTQSGGTFVAPSGSLTLNKALACSVSTLFKVSGGTFTANGGTLAFYPSENCNAGNAIAVLDVGTTTHLNNVTFNMDDSDGGDGFYDVGAFAVKSGAILNVDGNLEHDGAMLLGMFYLSGNLIVGAGACTYDGSELANQNYIGGLFGTTEIQMIGSANAAYTVASPTGMAVTCNPSGSNPEGSGTSNLRIAKSGGATVAPTVGTTDLSVGGFILQSGSFTAPSGTLYAGRFFDASETGALNANITVFDVNGGTFLPNGGTVSIDPSDSFNCCNPNMMIDSNQRLNKLITSYPASTGFGTFGKVQINGGTLPVAALEVQPGFFDVNTHVLQVLGTLTVDASATLTGVGASTCSGALCVAGGTVNNGTIQ